MTYELAIKLKEAGFPQIFDSNHYCYISSDSILFLGIGLEGLIPHRSWVYAPTLSELIEACGDGFNYLSKSGNDEWVADGFNDIEGEISSTPKEAVANLWLKLKRA